MTRNLCGGRLVRAAGQSRAILVVVALAVLASSAALADEAVQRRAVCSGRTHVTKEGTAFKFEPYVDEVTGEKECVLVVRLSDVVRATVATAELSDAITFLARTLTNLRTADHVPSYTEYIAPLVAKLDAAAALLEHVPNRADTPRSTGCRASVVPNFQQHSCSCTIGCVPLDSFVAAHTDLTDKKGVWNSVAADWEGISVGRGLASVAQLARGGLLDVVGSGSSSRNSIPPVRSVLLVRDLGVTDNQDACNEKCALARGPVENAKSLLLERVPHLLRSSSVVHALADDARLPRRIREWDFLAGSIPLTSEAAVTARAAFVAELAASRARALLTEMLIAAEEPRAALRVLCREEDEARREPAGKAGQGSRRVASAMQQLCSWLPRSLSVRDIVPNMPEHEAQSFINNVAPLIHPLPTSLRSIPRRRCEWYLFEEESIATSFVLRAFGSAEASAWCSRNALRARSVLVIPQTAPILGGSPALPRMINVSDARDVPESELPATPMELDLLMLTVFPQSQKTEPPSQEESKYDRNNRYIDMFFLSGWARCDAMRWFVPMGSRALGPGERASAPASEGASWFDPLRPLQNAEAVRRGTLRPLGRFGARFEPVEALSAASLSSMLFQLDANGTVSQKHVCGVARLVHVLIRPEVADQLCVRDDNGPYYPWNSPLHQLVIRRLIPMVSHLQARVIVHGKLCRWLEVFMSNLRYVHVRSPAMPMDSLAEYLAHESQMCGERGAPRNVSVVDLSAILALSRERATAFYGSEIREEGRIYVVSKAEDLLLQSQFDRADADRWIVREKALMIDPSLLVAASAPRIQVAQGGALLLHEVNEIRVLPAVDFVTWEAEDPEAEGRRLFSTTSCAVEVFKNNALLHAMTSDDQSFALLHGVPELRVPPEHASRPRVCLGIPTIWRKRTGAENVIKNSPLFKDLIPSFLSSIEGEGASASDPYYVGLVGYDVCDAAWDNSTVRPVLDKELRERAAGYPLQFVPVRIGVGGHGMVTSLWNRMFSIAMKSYACDYFFQINDDLNILSRHLTRRLIREMDVQRAGPSPAVRRLGTSAPIDIACDRISTQALVHRTHWEIFGFFYPPEIINWFSDDWLTRVYASYHASRRVPHALVHNEVTSVQTIRYRGCEVFPILDDEVRRGRAMIDAYLMNVTRVTPAQRTLGDLLVYGGPSHYHSRGEDLAAKQAPSFARLRIVEILHSVVLRTIPLPNLVDILSNSKVGELTYHPPSSFAGLDLAQRIAVVYGGTHFHRVAAYRSRLMCAIAERDMDKLYQDASGGLPGAPSDRVSFPQGRVCTATSLAIEAFAELLHGITRNDARCVSAAAAGQLLRNATGLFTSLMSSFSASGRDKLREIIGMAAEMQQIAELLRSTCDRAEDEREIVTSAATKFALIVQPFMEIVSKRIGDLLYIYNSALILGTHSNDIRLAHALPQLGIHELDDLPIAKIVEMVVQDMPRGSLAQKMHSLYA